uniref:Uncharacterized protein n=1 Tax=viral metagenome TaxID=1070528 RepID=A0A6M3IZF6_9ZZZZ
MKTKLTIESDEPQDRQLTDAIQQSIDLYPDEDIDHQWRECFSNCNFQRHTAGRGGNHIWFARRSDGARVAILENI